MANAKAGSADDLGDTVRHAAETLGLDIARTTHDAGEALRQTTAAFNRQTQATMEEAKEQVDQAMVGLAKEVRAHPFTYLAAAAGIGLVIGFLARRR